MFGKKPKIEVKKVEVKAIKEIKNKLFYDRLTCSIKVEMATPYNNLTLFDRVLLNKEIIPVIYLLGKVNTDMKVLICEFDENYTDKQLLDAIKKWHREK
jgi:hypothetical protein